MPAPTRPIALAACVLMTLIWGTTWAAIRVSLDGIPPLTGVALRFALAGAVLFGLAVYWRVPLGKKPREKRLWVINAVLSFSISYGVVYWCEQWLPSGLAAVLFATFPLFVVLLAHFTLPGERIQPLGALGTLVGFGGVAVIFSDDLAIQGDPRVAVAAVVMLLSPATAAVANVAVKRWGERVHPLSLTAVPMLMTGGLMGLVAATFEHDAEFAFGPAPVTAMVYLALFGSAVTFTLYFWLLAHMPASRLALVAYAIPVIAVTTGAVFLDEPLTTHTAAGAILVLLGVALASRRRRTK
jgi:drug/metabolite transporter (DMT)-like permease